MPYRFDILTLFPALFEPVRSEGLLGKAIDGGLVGLHTHNFRDWTTDKHRTVDDVPYGGGAGMVLKPDPVVHCLRQVRQQAGPNARAILLSPAGRLFRQQDAVNWAKQDGIILLCGRYEGFDHRIEAHVDEVVSIGDFVLNGGEVAALAIVEAVARLLGGVLGNSASLHEESHTAGLLEGPQYTRPRPFEDQPVPEVLLGGHHGEIARFRRRQALLRTQLRRPELLVGVAIERKDRQWLQEQVSAAASVTNPHHDEPVPTEPVPTERVPTALVPTELAPTPDLAERQVAATREKPVDKFAKIPIFAALVHHPVLDRTGLVVTTALTNVDVHDLARSAKTFGLHGLFVVTPVVLQQRMVEEITAHWTHGQGSSHRRRAAAMQLVHVAASVQQVRDEILKTTGRAPVVAVTAARHVGDQGPPLQSFATWRQRLRDPTGSPDGERPLLLVFGTGWGLAPELMASADVRLPPIGRDLATQAVVTTTVPGHVPAVADPPAYNHLSVRAAAAILFDRLLGDQDS